MGADSGGDAQLPFYQRVFAIALLAALAVLLYRVVLPFIVPLAWAVVLGFVLFPLQQRLTRLCGGRAGLSAALLTALTCVVLIGPMTLLGTAFAAQARTLLVALEALIAELKIGSVADLTRLPAAESLLEWLGQHLAISAEQLRTWTVAGAERLLQPLAELGGQAFLGAIGTVVNFALMLFLLYFLLRDGAQMLEATMRLVPVSPATRQRLVRHLGGVTRAVVFGTLVTAVLQGACVAIAFAVTALPSPIVFGVLAAVLSVLPIGGTAFVWGPAAGWLFVSGRPGAGAFMLVWGALIVGLADNLLRPLLISGRSEVPTLAVFLGVLGGLAAFGMIGMFIGPLVLSLAVVVVRFADGTLADR